MKIIQVTEFDKSPIYVNPEHIIAFYKSSKSTVLVLSNGHSFYLAESPAEIHALLKE